MSTTTNNINPTILFSGRVADSRVVLGKVFVDHGETLYYCAARDLNFADTPPSALTITHSKQTAIDAYTALVAEKAHRMADHVLSRDAKGIRVPYYEEEDCTSVDEVEYMYDHVLVLGSHNLESDFETGANQLVYCVDEPVNDGMGVFVSLLTADLINAYEDDFIGVLKDEDLPEWSRAPLSRLRERMGQEVEW